MRYEPGTLVRSLAGHDQNNLFIIIEESGEYVSLVDGKYRTLARPKRKNHKHIQVIRHSGEPQCRERMTETTVTDDTIKHIIRCCKREISRKEETICQRQT